MQAIPVIKLNLPTPVILTVEEYREILNSLTTSLKLHELGIDSMSKGDKLLVNILHQNHSRYIECKQILEGIRLDEEHDC